MKGLEREPRSKINYHQAMLDHDYTIKVISLNGKVSYFITPPNVLNKRSELLGHVTFPNPGKPGKPRGKPCGKPGKP